jgi:hypothetical protein
MLDLNVYLNVARLDVKSTTAVTFAFFSCPVLEDQCCSALQPEDGELIGNVMCAWHSAAWPDIKSANSPHSSN